MAGFIKLNKNYEILEELIKKPNDWTLLSVIAIRAKRSDCLITGLKKGECYLGDYENYGMTEQQYRTAKCNVQRYGLATFEGTNKGTIGRLTNSAVYDINIDNCNEPPNGQATDDLTDKQRTSNGQATTNKKRRREEEKKKEAEKKKVKKEKYGEFDNVALSVSEFKKLVNDYGEATTLKKIEDLSQYMASKGKRYKSHYATIKAWMRKEKKEQTSITAGSDEFQSTGW